MMNQVEVKKMNVLNSYRNWREYRSTVSELNRLSNRSLADLGLKRSDIKSAARRAM
jgi:uncharacterized protein YjiS (DUF1127 family)